MRDIILASSNVGKLKELQAILSDLKVNLTPQPKTIEYEVEETGTTFIENAIIKARHACKLSGLPSIADDSGLVVDSLGGQPGVHTARYAGTNCSQQENMDLVLKNLKPFQELEYRRATFVCALVYMQSDKDSLPIFAVGQWYGAIVKQPSGLGGFGYDPLFWDFENKMTAAQMTKDLKTKLSHRGQACQLLKTKLNKLWYK